MFIPVLGWQKTAGQSREIISLSKKLEKALNTKGEKDFKTLFHPDSSKKLARSHKNFKTFFDSPKWSVRSNNNKSEDKSFLDVEVKAKRKVGNHKYNLKAKQVLEIKIKEGKILDYKLINQESILKTENSPLRVKLEIPDEVLTGTIYDLEIILEDPLDNYIITGGLIETNDADLKQNASPKIDLKPIQSGGIFKSAKAPLKEGSQTWAALIAHPHGLIAITKMVRISDSKN